MKNLLAAATIVASLALAPAALATGNAPHGYRLVTDTLGGNGHAKVTQGYTFITDTLGGNGRPAQAGAYTAPLNPYQNTGSASAALQGYTTSGPGGNGTQIAKFEPSGNSFNWGDAAIGAAGAIGTTLILIGGSLVVLRKRNRLAV